MIITLPKVVGTTETGRVFLISLFFSRRKVPIYSLMWQTEPVLCIYLMNVDISQNIRLT